MQSNCCTLSCAHLILCIGVVRELFQGGVYFTLLERENQCGNNSRAGRIQGNTAVTELYMLFSSGKAVFRLTEHPLLLANSVN